MLIEVPWLEHFGEVVKPGTMEMEVGIGKGNGNGIGNGNGNGNGGNANCTRSAEVSRGTNALEVAVPFQFSYRSV